MSKNFFDSTDLLSFSADVNASDKSPDSHNSQWDKFYEDGYRQNQKAKNDRRARKHQREDD